MLRFAGLHRIDGAEMLANGFDEFSLLGGHGQELQPAKMSLAVANHGAQLQVFLFDLDANGRDLANLERPGQSCSDPARTDVGSAPPHFVLLARTIDGQGHLAVERVA